MIPLIIIGLAVLAGYIVTVGVALAGTMAIASVAPHFVVSNHRVRGPYKFVQELLWFFSAVAGAFVMERIGSDVRAILLELCLSAVLLFMLWHNTWEARQRGIAHQILISIVTLAGVGVGTSLAAHLAR